MNRSARGGGGKKCKALSGPTDWVLRYIKTYLFLPWFTRPYTFILWSMCPNGAQQTRPPVLVSMSLKVVVFLYRFLSVVGAF